MAVKLTVDKLKQFMTGVNLLADTRVMVGVPAEDTARQGSGPITNAALAYIHENGAPEANIPARPFLKPGIAKSQERIEGILKQAGQLALDGKPAAVTRALNAAGLVAVSSIKQTIDAGIPPPLAPATVARRRIRSKGSKYRRIATDASQTIPLVDTGQLRNAITYVIRSVK